MLTQYDKTYLLPRLHINSTNSTTDQRLWRNATLNQRLSLYENISSNGGRISSLAEKLQKNWLEKKQSDSKEMDDSLTNLNWLNNVPSILGPPSPSHSPTGLLNITVCQPTNAASDKLSNPNDSYLSRPPMNQTICASNNFSNSSLSHLDCALKDGGLLDPLVRHDYKTNWSGKPPFSYATLICMAMRELNKSKITLSDIYNWITDNFIYYRLSDSSWQNSVRHNLSLNKCFEKVPRSKDERGKGGFWRINPKYADRLESNLIKYRRQFPVYNMPKLSNGLPAASTLLSRRPESHSTFEHDSNAFYQLNMNSDGSWLTCISTNSPTVHHSQSSEQSLPYKVKKDPDSYLPNLPCGNSKMISSSAFVASNAVKQEDIYPCSRKSQLKLSQNYKTFKSQYPSKLQSLDEFHTSETGQKVDTQMRTDLTPIESPTMYSLLHQSMSPPSHVSLDDMDSAASSSFDAELTANTGSCATLHSHSDDPDDSVRFTSVLPDEFIVESDEYLHCDSIRNHDSLFDSVNGQFI